MNQTPLAVGGEEGEDSRPTLESPPEAAESRAAKPVVARREEDLLGARRQRDLARLSYCAGHDFGRVPEFLVVPSSDGRLPHFANAQSTSLASEIAMHQRGRLSNPNGALTHLLSL